MSEASDYGKQLWLMLAPTFDEATSLDGFGKHSEKAQAFTGFIAAVSGAMCAQVGADSTRAVLLTLAEAMPDIERDIKRGRLQVVKP